MDSRVRGNDERGIKSRQSKTTLPFYRRFLRTGFRWGLLRFGFGLTVLEAMLKIEGNSSANIGCNNDVGALAGAEETRPETGS